ncbi:HNH endonuclease signature motif containing protein [Phycicoccus duodecadis]|nr:HNH endonuclease signature motif containing protein [Phycicoccus duodecadis]
MLTDALSPGEVRGSQEEWAQALGELQAVIDTATAAQDAAIVRLAAIEPEVLDDGEVIDTPRALGHVALDASAIVSGVLAVTAVHAERRVRAAVRLAADGPEGTATETGLRGLHEAMGAGRLDAYRASVVATELEEAPAEVAASVIAGLHEYFGSEDGPRLRRRVRRMLARISPDLLRQRAVRARSECRLERWVGEPGVDTWHGTFPSEEAAQAWAAIDALAQQYVTDGVCEPVDRARAKALTDLVAGNATIDVQVVHTIAADAPTGPTPASEAGASEGAPGDLVEVTGLRPGEPTLVSRAWLDRASAPLLPTDTTPTRAGRAAPRPRGKPAKSPAPCDPLTGALLDLAGALTTDAYRPGKALVALVKARDGHCRFPGCHVAARFCDLDHVTPWPTGPTSAANLVCLCRRHHRIKQRPGWRAVLHPDATLTWTDPTGRNRTTHPVDHLHRAVLPDTGTDPAPVISKPRLVTPDGPHSTLEYHLEHTLGPPPARPHPRCRIDHHHPTAAGAHLTYTATAPPCRAPSPTAEPDPPF